jgi:hypothetical protein
MFSDHDNRNDVSIISKRGIPQIKTCLNSVSYLQLDFEKNVSSSS